MWYDDLPVIGRMTKDDAVSKLREIDEIEMADMLAARPDASSGLERAKSFGSWDFLPGRRPMWSSGEHVFGFIDPRSRQGTTIPMRSIGSIQPDPALKGGRIKVTLDRLRVADYPGSGTHHVLFDFAAQNQVHGQKEEVHFNMTLRVAQGETAAVAGYPIFLGLNVGTAGLLVHCYTVNVKNESDEKFLGFLESSTFRSGLKLASTLQPAIGPLSEMTFQLTRNIAARNRNVPVQDFKLGLDFGTNPLGGRLATGSYVAVQIPPEARAGWDWDEWVLDTGSDLVLRRENPRAPIPYNYLIFGVDSYTDT